MAEEKPSTHESEQEQEETEQVASSRPAAKFNASGGLQVAVWKHKNDEGRDRYSVRLDRSYRDKEGEYQTTNYLRDGDLLRVEKLLDQADDWIERDKAKQRGASQSQGQSR